ncbi:Brefeldin A resistance protein [Fagus crenata]
MMRTKESTAIFNNITGYARPQTMLALLGGNQTSKGTLLKCLAGRVPVSGSLSGNLQANGLGIGTTFSRLIGYVEKLDAHQPYLSVRESLVFSAALHLGQDISPTSRRIHVELVLNQLGLLPYSNELIGCLWNTTGKTFEIAKKITIAVELAANLSILLLEEPISGFDTNGTLAILNILSQVSDSGQVIISTLTHPNAHTLSLSDLALILTQDGHQAYFGPVGSNCNDVLGYFTSIPKAPHYSRRDSPVRFIMGALGIGTKKRGTPSLNFAQIYQASSLCEINNKEFSSIKKTINNRKRNYLSSTYPAPYSHQAILIEYKDIYGATSRTLYIYMQVILIGVISANNVIPQISTDSCRNWEWHGSYRDIIPFRLHLVLDSALHVYTMPNLFWNNDHYPSTSAYIGCICMSIVTLLWVSASGVVVLLPDIKFYRWMYWSNPFQYAMNVMTSISFYCNTKGCGSECKCPRLPDGSYV